MKQFFKEMMKPYKEFRKEKKLLNEQMKHLKTMAAEIKDLVRFSNMDVLDLLFEVNDRIETMNEFSKNLGVQINIGGEE